MKQAGPVNDPFLISTQGFLARVLLYGLLWVVLTGGRMESGLLGVPTVLMAAWISGKTQGFSTGRFSISGGVRFMGFFLKASLISGFDVIQRALHPRLSLHPDLIDYRLSLTTDTARIFMADVVSLLPGTLSANLAEANLTVHVLDCEMPIHTELRALEKRVAAMLEVDDLPPSMKGDVR